MADIKEYAYYRRGDQFAIMEVDTTTLPNTTFQGDTLWKSPQESITDGIEIEYSYSGKYKLNGTTKNINVFPALGWTTIDGYLTFVSDLVESSTLNWAAAPYNAVTSGTAGQTGSDTSDYIVIRGSSKWNGLHKVQTAGTTGLLKTYTKVRTQLPGVTETDIDFTDAEIIYNGDINHPQIFLADNFSVGDKIFVSGSATAANNGVFNISAINLVGATTIANSYVTVDTRHHVQAGSGTAAAWDESLSVAAEFTAETDQTDISLYKVIFEDSTKIYTDIDVLNDEADELPVSEHLSKAIVYFVKAKLAEDAGQFELKEYNMKEFYRLAHKTKTSREYGPTIVMPGSHAIR